MATLIAIHLGQPILARATDDMGRVFSDMGKPNEALAALQKARELKPDSFGVGIQHHGVCMQLGRFDDAATSVRDLIASLPDAPPATLRFLYDNLGMALEQLGDTEGAAAAHRKAEKLGN